MGNFLYGTSISNGSMLIEACAKNDLITAQQILNRYPKIGDEICDDSNESSKFRNYLVLNRDYALVKACENPQITLQTIKWIISKLAPNPKTYNYAFLEACKSGNIAAAIGILTECCIVNNYSHVEYHKGFADACSNGHLDLAKAIKEYFSNLKKNHTESQEYHYACKYGNDALAKKLKACVPELDINWMDSQAFRFACENERVNIVKWLVEIGANVTGSNNQAIRMCAQKGNTKIADLIFDAFVLANVHTSFIFDLHGAEMIYWCCLRNNVAMFHWFHEKGVNVYETHDRTEPKDVARHNSAELYEWYNLHSK